MAHTYKMESRSGNFLLEWHDLNDPVVEEAWVLLMQNNFTTSQIDKVFNMIRKTGITAKHLVKKREASATSENG